MREKELKIDLFVIIFFIVTIMSCERGDVASSSGLTPQASTLLSSGDITGAINRQVSGPTHSRNCSSSRAPASVSPVVEVVNQSYDERPSKLKSREKNDEICRKRAKLAKSRGINSLTIGFEGLMTYSSSYARSFYRYYDKLWDGKRNARPPRSLGNFVGKDLFAPNLKNNYRRSDFLLLSERGGAGFIDSCVAEYRREIGQNFKVNIVGLSFGAGEAMVLSEKLSEMKEFGSQGIKVNKLMTMDLRGSERLGGVGPRVMMNAGFRTPGNVRQHMNFGRFEAIEPAYFSPTVGYPGYRSRPSGQPGTQTINRLVPTFAGHARQVKRAEIQSYYRGFF